MRSNGSYVEKIVRTAENYKCKIFCKPAPAKGPFGLLPQWVEIQRWRQLVPRVKPLFYYHLADSFLLNVCKQI
jgi:hypothetical protein